MGKFFIFYFLFFPVHRQFHFPLFRSQDDRLAAHASDHVERLRRFPAQCKLERVLLDLLLDHFPELALDSEEPIRRTDPVDSLVGSFVVVELHPVGYALPGFLEVGELRTVQEVLEYRLPEPLDLPERHRMVWLAPDVFYSVLGKFHFKLRGAAPRRVLPPVVGEHLLRHAVFGHRLPVHFEHVLGGLAREEPQSDDVSRMVVDEPDQIRLPPAEPEREDVALPHLVRRRTLEKTRPDHVLFAFLPGGLVFQQLVLVKRLTHRLRARLHAEEPSQHVRDPLDPERLVFLFHLDDLRLYLRRDFRLSMGFASAADQTGLAHFPVFLEPVAERVRVYPELTAYEITVHSFLEIQPDRLHAELVGIMRTPLSFTCTRARTRSGCFGLCFLLCHE